MSRGAAVREPSNARVRVLLPPDNKPADFHIFLTLISPIVLAAGNLKNLLVMNPAHLTAAVSNNRAPQSAAAAAAGGGGGDIG